MIAASVSIEEKRTRSWPPRLWLGILLIAIFWPLNWFLPGLRTAYLFFPLWLGYILVIDALVELRSGSSLWTRSWQDFLLLFLLSAPAWWLFEVINRRLANWRYLGGEQFSDFEYYVLSSISFSTVMPAVFGTAELIRSYRWIDRLANGPRVPNTPRAHAAFLTIGVVMMTVMLIWPRYFYPFAWTSLVFILEPINYWRGHPHFTDQLARGDWRRIISLALGALTCGFFWEMWNYYSYPKWIYHTPGAQFLHIFEMPLLGYLGYIPFALELCALKNLICPKRIELRL